MSVLGAFLIAHLLVTVVLGEDMYLPGQLCAKGDGARKLHPLLTLFIAFPGIICCPVSLCADFLNLRSIKKVFDNGAAMTTNKKEKLCVPIHATVVSALTIIPYMAIIIR